MTWKVIVDGVRIPRKSTLGYVRGHTEDGRRVESAGDLRALRDILVALRNGVGVVLHLEAEHILSIDGRIPEPEWPPPGDDAAGCPTDAASNHLKARKRADARLGSR